MTDIRAVAVVIPARDEEDRIRACLRSVRAALDRLPSTVVIVVTVVLDRCTDATPDLVDALMRDWPGAVALRVVAAGGGRAVRTTSGSGAVRVVAGTGVGALRDLGVRDALDRLAPRPAGSVWLLHTDADTVVPGDWALAHLALAAGGAAGVAGLADLTGELSEQGLRRHSRLVLAGMRGDRHEHVYGANLGVRADAYLAQGGFTVDGSGEDQALWDGLGAAGYELATPTDLRVLTSSRTVGRARDGLADLLRDLDGEVAARPGSSCSPRAAAASSGHGPGDRSVAGGGLSALPVEAFLAPDQP